MAQKARQVMWWCRVVSLHWVWLNWWHTVPKAAGTSGTACRCLRELLVVFNGTQGRPPGQPIYQPHLNLPLFNSANLLPKSYLTAFKLCQLADQPYLFLHPLNSVNLLPNLTLPYSLLTLSTYCPNLTLPYILLTLSTYFLTSPYFTAFKLCQLTTQTIPTLTPF